MFNTVLHGQHFGQYLHYTLLIQWHTQIIGRFNSRHLHQTPRKQKPETVPQCDYRLFYCPVQSGSIRFNSNRLPVFSAFDSTAETRLLVRLHPMTICTMIHPQWDSTMINPEHGCLVPDMSLLDQAFSFTQVLFDLIGWNPRTE